LYQYIIPQFVPFEKGIYAINIKKAKALRSFA